MWKTYQRGVCITYSWPAMFGKLRAFRKCYYMYFQECLFKSTSTLPPPPRNSEILQAEALKLDKSFSRPPSIKQCSGSALSKVQEV